MAVTFAPGDNFRVAAMFSKPALEGVKEEHVPTVHATPRANLSGQLSVWRFLSIEDDTPNPTVTQSLMQSTTHRQNNRFAEAYLQPKYFDPVNGGTALAVPHQATLVRNMAGVSGELDAVSQGMIENARDTKNTPNTVRETDVFWVSYIGGGWTNDGVNVAGVTANDRSNRPWEWSILFNVPNLGAGSMAKIAVHEIGHQLLKIGRGRQSNGDTLDQDGHRGSDSDMGRYYNASDQDKADTTKGWEQKITIMNPQAALVPIGDPSLRAPFPGKLGTVQMVEGNNAGTIDRFYFYSEDIVTFRSRKSSPGPG